MDLESAARATLNLAWAGKKNELENWRLTEIWFSELGKRTKCKAIKARAIADVALSWGSLSAGTKNRRLSALSKILHTALDMDAIQSVPKIPRFKEPSGVVAFLEKSQVAMIVFEAKADEAFDDLIWTLYGTGARLGEALKMRGTDLFLEYQDRAHWQIPDSKSGLPRTVPLSSGVAKLLSRRRSDCDRGLVFGSELTSSRVQHAWAKGRAGAGLPDARIHDLRHTFASRLVRNGESLYTVAHLLGHRDPKTTARYAHLDTASLERAVASLEP